MGLYRSVITMAGGVLAAERTITTDVVVVDGVGNYMEGTFSAKAHLTFTAITDQVCLTVFPIRSDCSNRSARGGYLVTTSRFIPTG